MKTSEHDEERFEAFLQGADPLSQRLKALQQPEPPEVLSQAIHDRVEQALRNERQTASAANDGVPRAGAARPRRLRLAWAIAAGLLIAVAVGTQWRQETPQGTLASAQPEAAPAAAMPPAAQEAAPQAPSQPMLAQADVTPSPSSTVVRSVRPSATATAADNAGDDKARNWLGLIDGLLANGMRKDALDEWNEFRKSYPDYPVSKELKERIDAAQAAAIPESK
ncbi:hypothetical protein [Herbaspirillum sp.]|uniref:hypothetical protein n=1 Tax=Herbaspirillum sp. TaxID=1890675 RepID=UPI001B190C7C|nr:hypothetical protein [Herbaspirillum sp.]MBO9538082.1 anti-sigma factor [Herbaspirillum sp.]